MVAFTVSSIYMCTSQHKPFNPLLGETLQGNFYDGTKFYCEHTCHHPPISNFLIEDADGLYKMYGYYEITGKMGPNNLISGLRGPNNIVFADGQHIRFGFPSYKIGGTVMGERTVETIGSSTFEDLTNNRKAVVINNTYKKTGWIRSGSTGSKDKMIGIIYDSSKQLTGDAKSIKKNYGKDIEFVEDFKKLHIKKKICDIDGSWLNSLQIDGKTYWDIEFDVPNRQLPAYNSNTDLVLPSDWRYREDLIWLKYNYMLIAHQWKLRLEVQQRFDRTKRQAGDKRQGRKKH